MTCHRETTINYKFSILIKYVIKMFKISKLINGTIGIKTAGFYELVLSRTAYER